MNVLLDRLKLAVSASAATVRARLSALAGRPVPLWKSAAGLILGLLIGGVLGRAL